MSSPERHEDNFRKWRRCILAMSFSESTSRNALPVEGYRKIATVPAEVKGVESITQWALCR